MQASRTSGHRSSSSSTQDPPASPAEVVVGVISDTHGLLRDGALDALRGADLILHAGDLGDPEILSTLRELAPVHIVRGNVDHGPWAEALPWTDTVAVGDHLIHMLHIEEKLDLDPAAAGIRAVIFGHSHRPVLRAHRGVLFMNPGSAGPRRFRLPVTLGRIVVRGDRLTPSIIDISP